MRNTVFAFLLILAFALGIGVGVNRNPEIPVSAESGNGVPEGRDQLSSSNWSVEQHLEHDNGMTRRVVYRDSNTGFEYDLRYDETGRLRSLRTRRNEEETGPFFRVDAVGRLRSAGVKVDNEYFARSWWSYFEESSSELGSAGKFVPDTENSLAAEPLPGLKRENWTIREAAGLYHGAHRSYRPDGKLQGSVPTRNGKLNGPSFKYREDGSLEMKRIYAKGEESRRRAFGPNGAIRHLSISRNAEGNSVFEIYYPDGELKFRRVISGSEGSERLFYPDGTVQVETLRENGFPSERREYGESGALVSVVNYSEGEKRIFDNDGRLKLIEALRFNTPISRARYGLNGKLLGIEELDDPMTMLPESGQAIEFQSLPGADAKLPQAYHAYFEVPGLLSHNDRRRAWAHTMNDWFQETDFVGGTYHGWRPYSATGAAGTERKARFIAPPQLSAIGLAAHVARGPLWLSLTLYDETSGERSDLPMARSWVWLPEKPAFPSGGLIVFPLPEVELEPDKPYWFLCEVDKASSAENAYWNYPLLESEAVAYRLIGNFDSVPLLRPAKLDKNKSE